MARNPFSPPKAEVGDPGFVATPWHLSLAVGALVLWGCWALVNVVTTLAASAPGSLPLWYFYLTLIPPLATLVAAYVLWRRSHWALLPLILAPALTVGTYLAFSQAPTVSLATSAAGRIVERLPLLLLIHLAASAAVLVYIGFLKKWGHVR